MLSQLSKKTWVKWIKLAEIIGNVQMIILLTVIYWTMMMVIAIPFKILADPLGLKKNRSINWIIKVDIVKDIEYMRKQG